MVAPVQQQWDEAPDCFHGHADIRPGTKLASVMKTENSAVRRTPCHYIDDRIHLQFPILSTYRAHDAGEPQAPLRGAHSEPAHAEGGAKPDGGGTGVAADGFLGLPEVVLDECGRMETEERMGVAVIADDM